MNDEEIEIVINTLLTMLVSSGFLWAADQAMEAIPADGTRISVALALLHAAESVSVKLAETELAAHELLSVDEIGFKRDPHEGTVEAVERPEDRRREASSVQGSERIFALSQILEQKSAFEKLRRLFDGAA